MVSTPPSALVRAWVSDYDSDRKGRVGVFFSLRSALSRVNIYLNCLCDASARCWLLAGMRAPCGVTVAQLFDLVERAVLPLVLGGSDSTQARVNNKTQTPRHEELDLLRNTWLLDRPYQCTSDEPAGPMKTISDATGIAGKRGVRIPIPRQPEAPESYSQRRPGSHPRAHQDHTYLRAQKYILWSTASCVRYVYEHCSDIVDGLTHQINSLMPVYAPFARDCTVHTTLWHEPVEEENVGGGAVHEEVTCGSCKHITRSSQRRLSISRLRTKDGPLLATFSRGAIGRAKSARVSPLTTKIMHYNFRRALGRERKRPGHTRLWPVAKRLSGPTERKPGDCSGTWHMLQCTLPHETKVQREWHSAMRKALEGCTDNARAVNAAMACWSASDRGVIHTAVEDQAIGWQAPTTRMIGNDGKWEFANGPLPHL